MHSPYLQLFPENSEYIVNRHIDLKSNNYFVLGYIKTCIMSKKNYVSFHSFIFYWDIFLADFISILNKVTYPCFPTCCQVLIWVILLISDSYSFFVISFFSIKEWEYILCIEILSAHHMLLTSVSLGYLLLSVQRWEYILKLDVTSCIHVLISPLIVVINIVSFK